jgi:hypothetical protein
VATTIAYDHSFNYLFLPNGKRRPGFLIQLSNGTLQIDTKAFLDSGAEFSLFNGEFATALGLDLISGQPRRYKTVNNTSLGLYVHPVTIYIPELDAFRFQLGFSIEQITVNILGRDFFDLMRIGFDEHEQVFHVSVRR